MITFFTDPHIGLKRTANTTPTSRAQLRDHIAMTAFDIAANAKGKVICLGDLFDSYSNTEDSILTGRSIASMCDLVLGGNHDVTQDATKVGSLGLVAWTINTDATQVVLPRFNEVVHRKSYIAEDRTSLTAVPHHTTQALFEEALAAAEGGVQIDDEESVNILLLHCNYESPYDLTETSLNLTKAWAERLLEKFDYILLGHEHNPRDLFDGRLIILGNTFPTSFSDISDKRILHFEDGEMRSEWIWREAQRAMSCPATDIPEGDISPVQFLEIEGEVEHGQLAFIAKSISSLWRGNPQLLAVKSSVKVQGMQEAIRRKADTRSLPQLIEAELADKKDQLELWHEAKGGGR